MIDPARLAAFVAVTVTASIVPGPQMLFVMGQAAWRGTRAGVSALAGLQIGNAIWYLLAALGLGTLAKAAPMAFTLLTLAGAGYLAWLGIGALRYASPQAATAPAHRPRQMSRHAFRDSLLVSASNPKSLVYMLALLPPFVDTDRPVLPQIALLGAIGIVADVVVGAAYIAAGSSLARAMDRPAVRTWLERGIGTVFLLVAAGIMWSVIATIA